MLSEYRQRLGDYFSELYREDYLFRSGRKEKRETNSIVSDYSDLFRIAVIDDLRSQLAVVPDSRRTDAESIRRLIAFAVEGNLLSRTEEISAEIEGYEAAARIIWDGQQISFDQSVDQMASEQDYHRRQDLYSRFAELIQGEQDLLADKFEEFHSAARDLGYDSYLSLCSDLRGVDYEKIAGMINAVLSKTEGKLASALASFFPDEIKVDEATSADLGYLQRFDRFDHYLTGERILSVYGELFAGLGFRTDQQANIEIDSETRPRKQLEAFCSPIRVPSDIKLVLNLKGGQENYRGFLREAGHAQNFAWTSNNLYPEFRIGGDSALGWGMLFENLMLDEHWLLTTFGFAESEQFRRAISLFRLISVRRYCAQLNYAVEYHSRKLRDSAADTGPPTDSVCMRDLSDSFYSADILRACAFESQLREYLKMKFGIHWWSSRKAGEMLIDLWNTGQRYRPEELASMIGLGALDFDWLATELQEGI
jgi:hypothetical protein